MIDTVLNRVADCVEQAVNTVIVGAKGSGTSTVASFLMKVLSQRDLFPVLLDCRVSGAWQEFFREIREKLPDAVWTNGKKLVLVIDHASDLPPQQLLAIRTLSSQCKTYGWLKSRRPTLTRNKGLKGPLGFLWKATHRRPFNKPGLCNNGHVSLNSEIWLGDLDCRSLQNQFGLALAAEPRFVFQIPEYSSEHLLTLYTSICRRQDSEWGEAILYTILDWCGSDLSLAESLGAHFYGNWRNNIYDDTVAESIEHWLKTDQLVDEYRQNFLCLDEPSKSLVKLLNMGGKIQSHSPYCNQEPNESIRRMFLSGIVSPNLLPGFYQYRNLTVRLLALQSESESPSVDSLDLLRKYSNGRIGNILQDVELSLRLLALRCFTRMGSDAVREKLETTRTDEQAIPTDFRKSLLEWAKVNGGPDQQESLGRYITQYQKEFNAGHNLWSRIRELYATDMQIELADNVEPPFAKTVSFMTFSELSNLILSLGSTAFPRWDGTDFSREPPGRRWPAYLALLGRLRNQTAHLRNVAFQDMEDLFTIVREMRKDIDRYA